MEFILENETETEAAATTTTVATTLTVARASTKTSLLYQRSIEGRAEQHKIMLQVLQHNLLMRQQEQMTELIKTQLGSPISTRISFSPTMSWIGLAAMITFIVAILM